MESIGIHISQDDTVSSNNAGSRDSADRIVGGDVHSRRYLTTPATQPESIVSGDRNFRREVLEERDLVRQIDSARQALETQLEALRAADTKQLHPDLLANASARLGRLNILRDQLVGGANDVAALRADIASAVAASLAYTSDVRAAVSGTQGTSAQQAALYEASASARIAATDFMHDFYNRHVFDRYLKFSSTDDEEAYHRREQEYQRQINTALAQNTPQGNLRALQLEQAQLRDAKAHGADASPDFKPMCDRIDGERARLDTQVSAASHAVDKPEQKADAASPRDDKLASAVSPDVLASIRAAKIAVADQTRDGHGVTAYNIASPNVPSRNG